MKDIIIIIIISILIVLYFFACYRIDKCISTSYIHRPTDYLCMSYIISFSIAGGFFLYEIINN